ncbi:MAG: hypothetical protein ABL916_11565 [Burkholderiaceae bacterium]
MQVEFASNDFFEWRRANPLLKHIPAQMTFEKMGMALRYDPRSAWGGVLPPVDQMHVHCYGIKDLFAPEYQHIDAAMRFLSMVHVSLNQRDPRLPRNRALLYEQGRLKGKVLKAVPWRAENPWNMGGAMGGVIEAITGEGKTLFVQRLTSLFAHQVVDHEASEENGWIDFKQLVYLRVFMPTGAGKAGFILEIAKEMDRLLGTSYAAELTSYGKEVEKQLVLLLIWLSVHRCGMLIIEEAQERIISAVDFGKEFLLFFLKVLNWDIPLLLIGNPKALSHVRTFSQDNRRFSDAAWCTLEPITSWQDPAWKDDLVPAVWGYNVLSDPDEPIPNLPKFLWGLTGGSRSALARLRREALIAAISEGASSVTRKHVLKGYAGQSMRSLHSFIGAFVKKCVKLLDKFTDVPRERFAAKWAAERAQAEAARLKRLKAEAAKPAAAEADVSAGGSDANDADDDGTQGDVQNPVIAPSSADGAVGAPGAPKPARARRARVSKRPDLSPPREESFDDQEQPGTESPPEKPPASSFRELLRATAGSATEH